MPIATKNKPARLIVVRRVRGRQKRHLAGFLLQCLRWRSVCIAVFAISAAGEARADGAPPEPAPVPVKFEAALRVGLGLTFDTGYLNSTSFVAMPLGGDVGIRIDGGTFVGAFFQYSLFGSRRSAFCNGTCSSNTGEAGVEVLWHPLGNGGMDPWLGLGTGYEWTTFADSVSASGSSSGWEIFCVQFGVDFALGSVMKVGPYASFSVTEYVWNVSTPFASYGVSFGARLVILP
jgi:hypothetical protein